MRQGLSISALVGGLVVIMLLFNSAHDRRVVAVFALFYFAALVYLSKRKPRRDIRTDSDLCLTLSDLLYAHSPGSHQDIHVVFFRQEHRCASVFWSGKYLNDSSMFRLSTQTESQVTQVFDALHAYYIQHGLGHWNVAHFYVTADKRRFNLDVKMLHELENNLITFSDYIRRFM